MSLPAPLRVVEREARVFAAAWHATAFTVFGVPLLMLAGIGLGIGTLVDDGVGDLGGVSYLEFLAPGLLVASASQVACYDAMWAVHSGRTFDRRYQAMVSTSLRPTDVQHGVLCWVAVRVAMVAVPFLLVAAVLGAFPHFGALWSIPAAVLTGTALGAVLSAYAVTQDSDAAFSIVLRIGFMPLMFLSGIFFPVDELPGVLPTLVWLSPLWHGTELARAGATASLAPSDVVHVAALLALLAAGLWWGRRRFTAALAP